MQAQDRLLSDAEFAAVREANRVEHHMIQQEQLADAGKAVEAHRILKQMFESAAADELLPAEQAGSLLGEFAAWSSDGKPHANSTSCMPLGDGPIRLSELIEFVSSVHWIEPSLSTVVRLGMMAVSHGKQPLACCHGFVSVSTGYLGVQEVKMSLREALEHCYSNEDCQAVCTFNRLVKEGETQQVRFWTARMARVSRNSGKWQSWTCFFKMPPTSVPQGITYRMYSEGDNPKGGPGVIRSHYFCQILHEHGYMPIYDTSAPANFLFMNPSFTSKDPTVRMCNFPNSVTGVIDHKRKFWQKLLAAGHSDWTPRTFLSIEEFKNEAEGELWFLKEATAVSQQGVWCCRGGLVEVQQLLAEVAAKKNRTVERQMEHSVIQKGLEQLHLYDGKKYNMRVYALVVNRGEGQPVEYYMFESVHLRVFTDKYDVNSADPTIQIGLDGHTFQAMASELADGVWEDKLLPQIRCAVRDVCCSFDWSHSRVSTVTEFALLGFDFVVDSDLKTWCIEVNDWPCIEWKDTERGAMQNQFKQLVSDIYTLLVAPVFEGKPANSVHLKQCPTA